MKKKVLVLSYLLVFVLGMNISVDALLTPVNQEGTLEQKFPIMEALADVLDAEEPEAPLEEPETEPNVVPELEEEAEEPEVEPEPEEPADPEADEEPEPEEPVEIPVATFEKTLFIGDSRTVGLMEYGVIEDAHFFSDVGMTVYNINDKVISVPNVGRVTLKQLLDGKEYDKIYVMLGINELGYNMKQTVGVYGELIDMIQSKEPNAIIVLQGNLHVTKERSTSDSVINNPAINRFNDAVKQQADYEKVFYLDPNVLFDDEEGHLSDEKTGDQAHIYAKHYKEWADWIAVETGKLLWEANVEE